jgi:hypothetical protein
VDYRAELVLLIEDGTPVAQIMIHFSVKHHSSRPAMAALFEHNGLMVVIPHNDGITEERRRQSQELSAHE